MFQSLLFTNCICYMHNIFITTNIKIWVKLNLLPFIETPPLSIFVFTGTDVPPITLSPTCMIVNPSAYAPGPEIVSHPILCMMFVINGPRTRWPAFAVII